MPVPREPLQRLYRFYFFFFFFFFLSDQNLTEFLIFSLSSRQVLFQKGVNPNVVNGEGLLPIHIVMRSLNDDVIFFPFLFFFSFLSFSLNLISYFSLI